MSRSHVRGPEPVGIGAADHLPGRLSTLAERWPRRPVLAVPDGPGWRVVTRTELAERVRSAAAGLIARGLAPGDRVALMSPARSEWTVADLAVLSAGGVTVPLDDTSSTERCRRILADSGAAWAFAATADLADRLVDAGADDVFVLDDGGLDELGDDGQCDRRNAWRLEQRLDRLSLDDVATIVYRSGAAGGPRGCVLTHGNLAWTTRQTEIHLHGVVGAGGRLLLLLPLAHIFGRLMQFVCLAAGLQVGYPASPRTVCTDLRTFEPTVLLSTTPVFEKLYDAAQAPQHTVTDPLGHRRMRRALGGRVRYCLSGGSPLPRDLAVEFGAAGVPILEGYGLTETTAPVTANTPSRRRLGTAGRPLPGVEVCVDDEGEILVSGGNVFRGYHGDDAGTGFDDGWFRTGDLGSLDGDGFLVLHDRRKDLDADDLADRIEPSYR